MRSEPENSASNRGRLVDCTEGARQPTDFRRLPPPCSPAKALHPVPIRHWKIPDRLAQTARRCREGAEQEDSHRSGYHGPMAADDGTRGFVSVHHEAKLASRSRGSLKTRSSHLMPNVLECSPSNDQSDSEPQVVCCHHLERSAAPHFFPNPGT